MSQGGPTHRAHGPISRLTQARRPTASSPAIHNRFLLVQMSRAGQPLVNLQMVSPRTVRRHGRSQAILRRSSPKPALLRSHPIPSRNPGQRCGPRHNRRVRLRNQDPKCARNLSRHGRLRSPGQRCGPRHNHNGQNPSPDQRCGRNRNRSAVSHNDRLPTKTRIRTNRTAELVPNPFRKPPAAAILSPLR